MTADVADLLARRPKPERLTVPAQTKLTPSESDTLDEFVQFCVANVKGLEALTRSAAIRMFVADGLEAFEATLKNQKG